MRLRVVPPLLSCVAACAASPLGPGPAPDADDAFAGDERIDALELRVELRDATAGAAPVATLPAAVREAEAHLRDTNPGVERWLLAGGRIAAIVDKGHVVPPGTRMALREEPARARVAIPGRGPRGDGDDGTLPPRRLADVLEGGLTLRDRYSVEREPPAPDGELLGRPVRRQVLHVRFRARTGALAREVAATLTIRFAEPSRREAELARRAIDLVALPMAGDDGLLALHRAEAARGLPLAWTLKVRDDRLAEVAAEPVLEARVTAVQPSQVPRSELRVAGDRRAPGAPSRVADGSIDFEAESATLASLRPGAKTGVLAVRNRTPFSLQVRADGIPIGVVGGGLDASLGALPEGYWRVTARSLYGTYASGPRDLYVPGPVTFELP